MVFVGNYAVTTRYAFFFKWTLDSALMTIEPSGVINKYAVKMRTTSVTLQWTKVADTYRSGQRQCEACKTCMIALLDPFSFIVVPSLQGSMLQIPSDKTSSPIQMTLFPVD